MDMRSIEHAAVLAAERRGSRRVRDSFEDACKLLAPLVGQGVAGSGAACFKAMQRLHEAYPDLSPAEVEALAIAVCRALKQRS